LLKQNPFTELTKAVLSGFSFLWHLKQNCFESPLSYKLKS